MAEQPKRERLSEQLKREKKRLVELAERNSWRNIQVQMNKLSALTMRFAGKEMHAKQVVAIKALIDHIARNNAHNGGVPTGITLRFEPSGEVSINGFHNTTGSVLKKSLSQEGMALAHAARQYLTPRTATPDAVTPSLPHMVIFTKTRPQGSVSFDSKLGIAYASHTGLDELRRKVTEEEKKRGY